MCLILCWCFNATNAFRWLQYANIESKNFLIDDLEHKVAISFGDREMIDQMVCVVAITCMCAFVFFARIQRYAVVLLKVPVNLCFAYTSNVAFTAWPYPETYGQVCSPWRIASQVVFGRKAIGKHCSFTYPFFKSALNNNIDLLHTSYILTVICYVFYFILQRAQMVQQDQMLKATIKANDKAYENGFAENVCIYSVHISSSNPKNIWLYNLDG